MAGDDGAATESPMRSSGHQETAPAENEARPQQSRPSPPLPPRSQAPPPPAALQGQPLPPPFPGVRFAPLPQTILAQPPSPLTDSERPHFPAWDKTSLALGSLSLVVAAVIVGVSVAFGYYSARYFGRYDPSGADQVVGTSGAAAGLAMVVTALEFLTTSLSARRQGLHPGVLVAFHLITWLAALGAVVVTALYVAYGDFPDYEAPRTRLYTLVSQYVVYEQVVLGFDSVLLLAQFILFVGSCVETNAVEKARRGVVVVRVPYPAGAPYAGGQYPLYGPPQSLVAPPGSHPGQYPVPLMSQVPRQPDGKTAPAAPEPVALYGGYYAPAPPEMAWRASQQQANTTQPVYEYYAPAPAPTNRSARSSQPQSSAPPPASGSGSRRSQRHAQSQSAASPPPAPQQAPQQGPS